MTEWRWARFNELAIQERNLVKPSNVSGLPYIGLEHIGEGSLCLISSGVAEDVTSTKLRFSKGDILFGKLRPYFRKLVRAPFDGICSTDIWVIKPRKGVDAGFLFYLMASDLFLEPVVSASDGTKMPRANWEFATEIEVPLPPIYEQRSIASILGTLDDKIELNRRMSETLEEMSRAIYKSWFMDFDPVRAKAEGRDPGLPNHIADLFPDSFEDSEMGEIPKGWEVNTIGNLVGIVGGNTPRKSIKEFWEGGTHYWVTPKDLSHLSVPVLLETAQKVTDLGLSKISSGLLPVGTVLLSSRAPIGYLAITEIPVAINQGFIAMLPFEEVSNLFMLRWAENTQHLIVSYSNGSTFQEISKSNFRELPIVTPSKPVMNVFDTITRPMYRKVVQLEQEARTLIKLRKLLLPKLVSGEIRVNDVVIS